MRIKFITPIVVLASIVFFIAGCDMLGIGGDQPALPAPVVNPQIPVQPAPVAPVAPAPVAPAPVVAPVAPAPMAAAPVAPAPPAPVAAAPAAPAPTAPVAAAPVAAAPVAVPAQPALAGDPIASKMAASKAAGAADKTATSSLMRALLNKNKETAYNVQLPGAPYCHTFIAVGNDSVANVDLSLTSPTAIVVAADATKESTALISNYCPTTPGLYTLKVKMSDGSGEFGVQVFSK